MRREGKGNKETHISKHRRRRREENSENEKTYFSQNVIKNKKWKNRAYTSKSIIINV